MLKETSVKEIMNTSVVSITKETPLKEVVRLLENHPFSGLPVVDEQERVIGIISEKDILKHTRWIMGRPFNLEKVLQDYEATTVEDQRGLEMIELVASTNAGTLMTDDVITVNQEAPIMEAVKMINQNNINRLPVVDNQQKLVGIVTRANLIVIMEKWVENS